MYMIVFSFFKILCILLYVANKSYNKIILHKRKSVTLLQITAYSTVTDSFILLWVLKNHLKTTRALQIGHR